MHLEETEGQVTRLERVFELLDEKPRGKHCAGMAGIIEEGTDIAPGRLEDAVLDAMPDCRRARERSITRLAAYGTAIAWAEALELDRRGAAPAGIARRREGRRQEAVSARRIRHQPGGHRGRVGCRR